MSTHKHSNWLWKGNQASRGQMLSTTVSGVKTVAEIVNRITNVVDIGPPGLKTGLTGLIYVLDAIQVSNHPHSMIHLDNKPWHRKHRKICQMLKIYWRKYNDWLICWKSPRGKGRFLPLSGIEFPSFRRRSLLTAMCILHLTDINRSLNTRIQELDKITSRNFVKRLAHHSDDAATISDHIQAITWSIQSLTVSFLAQHSIFYWIYIRWRV